MNDGVLVTVLLAALGGLAFLAHNYPQIFKGILFPVTAIPAIAAVFAWGFETGRNRAYVVLLKHTGPALEQADAAFKADQKLDPVAVTVACIAIAVYVQLLDFVATASAKRSAAAAGRTRRIDLDDHQ